MTLTLDRPALKAPEAFMPSRFPGLTTVSDNPEPEPPKPDPEPSEPAPDDPEHPDPLPESDQDDYTYVE